MPGGALISVWDGIIPGREAQAIDVFTQLQAYWQRQQDAGRVTSRRAYLSTTPGDSGFELVQGNYDELAGLLTDDGHRDISILARSVMERLRTHLCIDALGGGAGPGVADAGGGCLLRAVGRNQPASGRGSGRRSRRRRRQGLVLLAV